MIVHIPSTWRKTLLRAAAILLAAGGLAALAFWGAIQLERYYYQRRAERLLEQKLRPKPPSIARVNKAGKPSQPAPHPRAKSPETGEPVGKLVIPRLDVSVVVLEGDDDGTLRHGAGRIPGTALPGTRGNIGIAAHRDTFFRPLSNIRTGDRILLTTPQDGTRTYEVEWHRIVNPGDVGVLGQTMQDTLTLVTCYPFHYIGHAPKRWIVRARAAAETNPPTRWSNNGRH